MNRQQRRRFENAKANIRRVTKVFPDKRDIENEIISRLEGYMEVYTDEDGVRQFEKMPNWDTIAEVEEELIDAFIYSTDIASEAKDLTNKQLIAMMSVSVSILVALKHLKEVKNVGN